MLKKIGQEAYKLELPAFCKIQLVFHVSCLNKKLEAGNVQQTEFLSIQEDGRVQLEPVVMLGRCTVKRNNGASAQWLIP